MKTYNKLVRDNIPNKMINDGHIPIVKTLTDHEYLKELKRNLNDEVQNYLNSKNMDSLVEIEELIRSILICKNITYAEFENLRKEKNELDGSFKKRTFLIEDEKD